jgi:hypothetical protein
MIKFVGLNPLGSSFHQKLRIIILIRKECIKRDAYIQAFGVDLLITDLDDLGFQRVTHVFSNKGRELVLGAV